MLLLRAPSCVFAAQAPAAGCLARAINAALLLPCPQFMRRQHLADVTEIFRQAS